MIEAIEAGELPTDLLVVGPAGTGKTYAILLVLHLLANDHPGLRILICRATRAALTESVCVTYEDEILPRDGAEHIAEGTRRDHRRAYRYPNGSTIVLGGLDKATRILSTAWDIVYVNEAIETTEEFWEAIKSRLNRPGRPPEYGWLIGDTNPGHPSHWLKRREEGGHTALWDTSHRANPALWDGDWTDAGIAYLEQLDTLTGTRRSRLRDGLWVAGEGAWFDLFDPAVHVSESAAYDPRLPVHLAVDVGVFTGSVLFQVRGDLGSGGRANVFGDYIREGLTAEQNAHNLLDLAHSLCGGRIDYTYADPAGNARNAVGPRVLEIYERAGLHLDPWKVGPVVDGLAVVSDLLGHRADDARLSVHPRCKALIDAFGNYMRKKVGNVWLDVPADPQHPYEDVLDALRGGLYDLAGGPSVIGGSSSHVYRG